MTARPAATLRDVIAQMKATSISQLPVVDDGKLRGIVAEVDLLRALVTGRQDARVAHRRGGRGRLRDGDAEHEDRALQGVLADAKVAIVEDGGEIVGIVTKIDLIDFLAKSAQKPPVPAV